MEDQERLFQELKLQRKNIQKAGFLYLKGNSVLQKKYKRFWFELDSQGEYLVIYTTNPEENKQQVVGVINLKGSRVEAENTKKITIRTKKGTFILQAETPKLRDEWFDAFIKGKLTQNLSNDQLNIEWNSDPDCAPYFQSLTSEGEAKEVAFSVPSVFQMELFDPTSEKSIALGRIVGSTVSLIVLLRHFGCILARQMMAQINKKLTAFEELGLNVIVVGSGNAAQAKVFKKETHYKGNIWLDPSGGLYKAFECKRGKEFCLGPNTYHQVKRAIAAGLKYPSPPIQGDPFQNGGLFVVSQKHGVIFKHIETYAGHLPNMDELFATIAQFQDRHPYDTWSTPELYRTWDDLKETSVIDERPLIQVNDQGWNFEFGKKDEQRLASKDLYIVESVPPYKTMFLKKDHSIWVYEQSSKSERDDLGPVVFCILNGEEDEKKALVFTQKGIVRRIIPTYAAFSEKDAVKYLIRQVLRKDISFTKFTKVQESICTEKIKSELLRIEQLNDAKMYKFGVLYVKDGQMTEQEFYSNVRTSKDFEEFLNFLGERVKLRGFTKFAGGLDTGNNETTGTESVFADYLEYQIMFHVSTLIPYVPDDEQQIERKRHIGNDIVMIVFKEGTQPFDPQVMRSKFNHVFVVIQKEAAKGPKTYYRMHIANKPGVPPYTPFLPHPPVFEKDNEFRHFLFTKLINAERATVGDAPTFRSKIAATRKDLLTEVVRIGVARPRTASRGASSPIPRKMSSDVPSKVPSAPPSTNARRIALTRSSDLSETVSAKQIQSPGTLLSPRASKCSSANTLRSDRLETSESSTSSPRDRLEYSESVVKSHKRDRLELSEQVEKVTDKKSTRRRSHKKHRDFESPADDSEGIVDKKRERAHSATIKLNKSSDILRGKSEKRSSDERVSDSSLPARTRQRKHQIIAKDKQAKGLSPTLFRRLTLKSSDPKYPINNININVNITNQNTFTSQWAQTTDTEVDTSEMDDSEKLEDSVIEASEDPEDVSSKHEHLAHNHRPNDNAAAPEVTAHNRTNSQ
jgi:hypothetical protein